MASNSTWSSTPATKAWIEGGEPAAQNRRAEDNVTTSSSTVQEDEETWELRLAAKTLSIAKPSCHTDWICMRCGLPTKLEFPRPDASQDKCAKCSGRLFLKERKKKKDVILAR
jgi:DNA-directed RNA polymerase subunit RPC12/RpoP